jgi:hypothetical protein
MRALIFMFTGLALTGCFQASGRSEIILQGEATVKHTLDISVCDDLEGEAKTECIKTVLEILQAASKEPVP